MTILASSNTLMSQVKSDLNSKFDTQDLGLVKQILGMEITQDKTTSSFFFLFFVQKFITRCSIAVRSRLSTTSSLHRPQGPDCPITGKRHYQYQRRNLTEEERELNTGCS